jgi:hypothetical protein
MGRCFYHLQLLGDALSCHIARPSRQRRKTSLQASWSIINKGNMGQPRAAESRQQLEPLLERLPILLIGGILNGDGVITIADFTAFLHFALHLICYIFKSRGGGSWVGDKPGDVILQTTTWVSSTTPAQLVLKGRGLKYVPCSVGEPRRTWELGKECKAAYP